MKECEGFARVMTTVMLGAMVLAGGCVSTTPPEIQPRVTVPVANEPAVEQRVMPDSAQPPVAVPSRAAEILRQEQLTGELVKFGKLRTVIQCQERVIGEDGAETAAAEIKPALEKEFARRDFRMFSGAVPNISDTAQLTRKTRAHLLIGVDAKSEFVNTTGKFSKYRATADARVIRAHDGTILAVAKIEQMGPREQDAGRAGIKALRAIQEELSRQLIEALLEKSDQLLWAGLVVTNVPDMATATEIQNGLEKSSFVSYAELLEWNKETKSASFEIIYGTKHESDILSLVNGIPRMKVKPSEYAPGKMEVFRKTMLYFK